MLEGTIHLPHKDFVRQCLQYLGSALNQRSRVLLLFQPLSL